MENYFKVLRKKRGVSQLEVAEYIGVSRSTYISIEAGKREVKQGELNTLADFYQLSPSDVLLQRFPKENDGNNTQKAKETILYILRKIGARPNVGETVLYKILSFIDFDFYELHERSITGFTYQKNHFGPTPLGFSEVVQSMENNNELKRVMTSYFGHSQKKYLPLREPNLDVLSGAEMKTIDLVIDKYGDLSANQLSHLSHEDAPWNSVEMGESIHYNSVFQRGGEFAQRDYEQEMASAAARDVSSKLDDISKEEYEYYKNL